LGVKTGQEGAILKVEREKRKEKRPAEAESQNQAPTKKHKKHKTQKKKKPHNKKKKKQKTPKKTSAKEAERREKGVDLTASPTSAILGESEKPRLCRGAQSMRNKSEAPYITWRWEGLGCKFTYYPREDRRFPRKAGRKERRKKVGRIKIVKMKQ